MVDPLTSVPGPNNVDPTPRIYGRGADAHDSPAKPLPNLRRALARKRAFQPDDLVLE